jgi:hypothetical protein
MGSEIATKPAGKENQLSSFAFFEDQNISKKENRILP